MLLCLLAKEKKNMEQKKKQQNNKIKSIFKKRHSTIIFCPDMQSRNDIEYWVYDLFEDDTICDFSLCPEFDIKMGEKYDLAFDIMCTFERERLHASLYKYKKIPFPPERVIIDLDEVSEYIDPNQTLEELGSVLIKIDKEIVQKENVRMVYIMTVSDLERAVTTVVSDLKNQVPDCMDRFTVLAVTNKNPLQLITENGLVVDTDIECEQGNEQITILEDINDIF